jgi:hypothetical protein
MCYVMCYDQSLGLKEVLIQNNLVHIYNKSKFMDMRANVSHFMLRALSGVEEYT